MEVASVAHENIKLQEDIRKREETIQNLIYRYAQCEQRVRDFIKHTLRLFSLSSMARRIYGGYTLDCVI